MARWFDQKMGTPSESSSLKEEISKMVGNKTTDSKKDSSSGKSEGFDPKKKPDLDPVTAIVALALGGLFIMYLMPDLNNEITTTEFINAYVASRQVSEFSVPSYHNTYVT